MTEYSNENRFSLFRNKDRKTDSHPEFGGSLNVNGVEYWLSAWVKESGKTGEKFFSGSIKPKTPPASKPAQPQTSDLGAIIDDYVPFMMEWR